MAIDSTVRWFHSDMVGAPQIESPWTGTLVAILDACLVNGFGAVVGSHISVTDEVATVTPVSSNTFERHAVITVSNVDPSSGMTGLEGDWRVATSGATTFTYACPGVPNGTTFANITRATPGSWERAFYDAGTHTAAYRSTHENASGAHFRIYDDYSRRLRCVMLYGENIIGQAENLTLDIHYSTPTLRYNETDGWMII